MRKLWKNYGKNITQPYTGNEIKTKPIFFKPFYSNLNEKIVKG
jgi:hypothetical protein